MMGSLQSSLDIVPRANMLHVSVLYFQRTPENRVLYYSQIRVKRALVLDRTITRSKCSVSQPTGHGVFPKQYSGLVKLKKKKNLQKYVLDGRGVKLVLLDCRTRLHFCWVQKNGS